MKTLLTELAGTTAQGPLALGPDVRAYRFTHPERGEVLVTWSLGDPTQIALPLPAEVVVSRDGDQQAVSTDSILVSSSPQYLWSESGSESGSQSESESE